MTHRRTHHTQHHLPVLRIGQVTLAVLVLVSTTGCYSRTVKATGLRNRGVTVEEGYSEAWPIEPVVREIEKSLDKGRNKRNPQKRKGYGMFKLREDR